MSTLNDLRALGYDVGLAYGDVDVEREALADALSRATPQAVAADAETVTRAAIAELRSRGVRQEALIAKAAEIAAAALEMTQAARDDEVAFHERAVAIAEQIPTVVTVSGYGLAGLQIPVGNDAATPADPEAQAAIDAIAADRPHRWRRFDWLAARAPQARRAALLEARELLLELRGKGYDPAVDVQDDGTGLEARIHNAETDERVQTVTTLAQLRAAARDLPDLTGG